jgi:hypothetical protein
MGEPASTRAHHACPRNRSANTWREFLQLIDILRIADKRERQLTCLLKIVIVDFQALHRWKFAGKTLKISESSRNDVRRMAMQTMVSTATPHQTSARRCVTVRAMKSLMRMSSASFCKRGGFTMA